MNATEKEVPPDAVRSFIDWAVKQLKDGYPGQQKIGNGYYTVAELTIDIQDLTPDGLRYLWNLLMATRGTKGAWPGDNNELAHELTELRKHHLAI